MKQIKIASQLDARNRILMAPDSEMKYILLRALDLVDFEPEILERIGNDLKRAALDAKALREADKRWIEEQTKALPGEDWDNFEVGHAELALEGGRPRKHSAEMVYVFLVLRGHWGSITDKTGWERVVESQTLGEYLEAYGLSLPARTTILEHVNHVSNQTRQFIFNAQFRQVIGLDLDDLREQTIDSTACNAHSSWPTDSRILMMTLSSAHSLSQKFDVFGLKNLNDGYLAGWLKKLRELNYSIALTSGKACSKGKVKKLYRQFLKNGAKILDKLIPQLDRLNAQHQLISFAPSLRMKLDKLVELLHERLYQACRIYEYTTDRIFHDIVLPAPSKILSLSDPCASFIKKGGREAVIGYKPQIGRSANGFITSFELQVGNPSDAARLVPMVEQHIERTGRTPILVSTDDGYASKKGRERVLDLGVKHVSISGSKGHKITPQDEWDSPVLTAARVDRSAVESIMFVLKYKFDFGELSRTGIEAATAELLEKIIVHNLWRMAYVDKQKKAA